MKNFLKTSLNLLFLSLIFSVNLSANESPKIAVSIDPIAWIVEQILGENLDENAKKTSKNLDAKNPNLIKKNAKNISVILPKNADEHSFDFKPNLAKMLENSDIFFAIGLEFEQNLRLKFPKINSFDLGENLRQNNDLHLWLDPILAINLAEKITLILSQKFPQNAKIYAQNLAKFQNEMHDLNTEISTLLKDLETRKFIIYHPSLFYFAKRFDLEQIAVEKNGKEPKTKDLQELVKRAKSENLKLIFATKNSRGANFIAEQIDAKIIEFNPLEKDIKANLLNLANTLKKGVR